MHTLILSTWVVSHRAHDATCRNGIKCMFGNNSPHFPRLSWKSVSYPLTLPCMSLRSATHKMWSACSVKQAEVTCLYYSLLRQTCLLLRMGLLCYATSKLSWQITAYLCGSLLPLRTLIHLLIRNQNMQECWRLGQNRGGQQSFIHVENTYWRTQR